jgi:hypothetical protein
MKNSTVQELTFEDTENVNGGNFILNVLGVAATTFAAGYAKEKYDQWRDSLNEPEVDGISRAG